MLILLLTACVRYVPVECPYPPPVPKPEYAPIDTTATPPEQMRQIVDRFLQCHEYSSALELALEPYKE